MHLKALLLIREPIVCCFYSAGKNIFIFVFPNNCLSDFHLASTPIFRMSSKSHPAIVNWIMVSIPENKLPRLQITIHRSSAIFRHPIILKLTFNTIKSPGMSKALCTRPTLALFYWIRWRRWRGCAHARRCGQTKDQKCEKVRWGTSFLSFSFPRSRDIGRWHLSMGSV